MSQSLTLTPLDDYAPLSSTPMRRETDERRGLARGVVTLTGMRALPSGLSTVGNPVWTHDSRDTVVDDKQAALDALREMGTVL